MSADRHVDQFRIRSTVELIDIGSGGVSWCCRAVSTLERIRCRANSAQRRQSRPCSRRGVSNLPSSISLALAIGISSPKGLVVRLRDARDGGSASMSSELLRRYGRIVFKAHRLLHHSTRDSCIAQLWTESDWYSIAEQPAPAPHLTNPEGCAALRIVLVTVPRVSRSCEHLRTGVSIRFEHRCREFRHDSDSQGHTLASL